MYTIYARDLAWDASGELTTTEAAQLLYAPGVEEFFVMEPKLTMEINKAGSLEFRMPQSHPLVNYIHEMSTTVTVCDGTTGNVNTDKIIWKGRITKIEKDFYQNLTVYCEGALAFLNDTLMEPYDYKENNSKRTYHDTKTTVAALFKTFIDVHGTQASAGRKITLAESTDHPGTSADQTEVYCTVTKTSWEAEHYKDLVVTDGGTGDDTHLINTSDNDITPDNSSYSVTFDELNSKLLDEYHGYLKLFYGDNETYRLGYYKDYGERSEQHITFGENLLDFAETQSAEDIFTRILPIGASDLMLGTGSDMYIENSTAIQKYGKITRTESWSDVKDKTELARKGRKFLLEGSRLSQTIAIKAVDLSLLDPRVEKIEIGDMIRVASVYHNVDDEYICSQVTIDIENPANTEYVFGDTFATLTGTRVLGATIVIQENQNGSSEGSEDSGGSSGSENTGGEG